MHPSLLKNLRLFRCLCAIFLLIASAKVFAQNPKIIIDSHQPGSRVSKDLHGIFFEEISHGGEGGLYAELIQNRSFEESRIPEGCTLDSGWIVPPRTEHFGAHRVVDWKMPFEAKSDFPAWSLTTHEGAKATVALDLQYPLHVETPRSLRINISKADPTHQVAVVNDGYWGIKVEKGATYRLTFYTRAERYEGDIIARLIGADGRTLSAQRFALKPGGDWQKFNGLLKATSSDDHARFHLVFSKPGTVWIDFVSLFPSRTFKNRPNGMRSDLANYLADLKPAFLRWPGGCFVEGISVESAPNWKRSLGPIEKRAGTYSPWGYWSTDGIGYHEFLQFCEDIDAKAMYVFNCGIACEMRSGVHVKDDGVPGIVADVLDAIEYAIGPKESKWGSVRAANGHPEPFPLQYIEVGNEQVGVEYAKRFNVFYKAIKEKYPQLDILAAMGIAHLHQLTIKAIDKMEFADEHAYKAAGWAMNYHDWYDKYERKDWKLYVGEYACNAGVGNGNMTAALNDATFILGMERNSDLIKMSSYAPLLENVNDTDWPVNLIRFDNARSFARISYYAIKMLNENKASFNLNTRVDMPIDNNTPFFKGGIALSTWDTQAEFRDVEVIENNKVVYQSGSVSKDWLFIGGKWSEENGVIAQQTEGAWPMAILQHKIFSNYSLKLKARKIGGYNAFMIPFAIKDNDNYLRVHIGAWLNKIAAFESVTKGADAIISQPVRLENPIEINRWYDVELQVTNNSVVCFLDGNLLMRYEKPRDFFALAGEDEQTKEVVVKVVNASSQVRTADVDFPGTDKISEKGKSITLSSFNSDDENSFEKPMQFVPVSDSFKVAGPKFQYAFKPWSITILRVKKK